MALLTAIALTIFMVELQLPGLSPVPGIKLGLSNIVTVWAVFTMGPKKAAMILAARVFLGAVFSGQMSTILYSGQPLFRCGRCLRHRHHDFVPEIPDEQADLGGGRAGLHRPLCGSDGGRHRRDAHPRACRLSAGDDRSRHLYRRIYGLLCPIPYGKVEILMENYFHMHMDAKRVGAISNLGLAHIGDGVFELLTRSWLCGHERLTVGRMHKDTIALVQAKAQAKFAEAMLPILTEEEKSYYRRGKNSHVHAVPKSCTPAEYAKATGVEAMFGALYLLGQTDRINELFVTVMEELYGI